MIDGALEATGILALLEPLAGGRVYEGIADDAEIQAKPDGSCLPHLIVSFGVAVPKARDRGIGVTEAGQPHIFPFSVTSVGPSANSTRLLDQAVTRKLIGQRPSADNSGEITGRAGSQYVSLNANLKPSRFHRIRYGECVIGLAAS